MCRNQLRWRNITDEQRTYLIGEAYRAQKMTIGNHAEKMRTEDGRFSVFHHDDGVRKESGTAMRIAKTFGVGSATVERAGQFVESLDAAETVSSGFKEAVLTGAVKAPKKVIQEIRNIPEAQRPAAVEAIKTGQVETTKQKSRPQPSR